MADISNSVIDNYFIKAFSDIFLETFHIFCTVPFGVFFSTLSNDLRLDIIFIVSLLLKTLNVNCNRF